MAINGISGIDSAFGQGINSIAKNTEAVEGASFKDMLTNAVEQADDLYKVTEVDTQALLAGEVDNIAQVMVNSSKSSIALEMVVQVRNKVVDAYNEIMRMQV